ncbi:glycoside hydrolase domain-containing protein [Bifidobacterium leontopitheci]|uniref:Bacterial Ig-like domain (Group 2) n=1 Tax=Bifidobacterium leontopitheci TaxID=2650774 RepID=A0A6I1GBC3_9BIFI|nr:glycoside hydrolase domain-containing protein [Bifidobacterium leontopitheci]KAB7788963.1 Bacterial Ig-like domain (group 2) [Bifidobacterium leontopitheci]
MKRRAFAAMRGGGIPWKAAVGLLSALAMMLSMLISPVFASTVNAAEDTGTVVDDTVTDTNQPHYFTYNGGNATDTTNGGDGWVADTKASIQGDNAAKTQHWAWTNNTANVNKWTYDFTFTGTGVELIGVKSDAKNNFQLDNGDVEETTITGEANTPTTLYKKTGLTYGKHTVKVTPMTNGTGLQVSYAKVYTSTTKTIKVATVGDSLTEGYKSSGGNKSDTAYPAWLQKILGSGYEVKNYGKTGATLRKNTNNSYWNSTEFTESKNYQPDIVVMMLGTNDSKDANWDEAKYKADAKELVDTYKNLPSNPTVYFATSPHAFVTTPATAGDISTSTIDDRLHPAQEALIKDNSWKTIDMYAATADRRSLYDADGVHFTDAGYKFVAEQVAGTLLSKQIQATIIKHTKTSGDSNKFTFSSRGWDTGNDKHTWSQAPSASLPASDIWYQVTFVGDRIDIYSGKNKPMGKVKYYIDGVERDTVSLYNASNIDETYITSYSGLGEGEHTFKAVATGEKDAAATNTLIDCAKVIVYHSPYDVQSVNLNTTKLTLGKGETASITAAVKPDYVDLTDLTYTSSAPNVATVSATGEIEAKAIGTATITAASKDAKFSGTVAVTVSATAPVLRGGIVDTDTQYTQQRFAEVKANTTAVSSLTAWRNDKVNAEIALAAVGSKLDGLTVTPGDLKTADGKTIAASNVKATFIKSTKAYNGKFLGYGSTTREVPADDGSNRSESNDILYQSAATAMSVEPNKVQNVWLQFGVPKDAAAGTYTGTVTASATGQTPLTFTYTLEVLDATLPDATEFKNSFDIELWQYPYSSAEYYDVTPFSEEHFKILKSSMELYKSIGGSTITTTISEDAWSGQTYSKNAVHYTSMVKWTKENGKFTYDWTNFDKWVEFNKSLGIGDKIILYSIAPWTNSFTYYENGKLVKKAYTVGSAEWTSTWKDFLSALTDHLMTKGWYDDAYIGIDERNFDARVFDLIDSVKNIHDETLKTAGSMDKFIDKHDLAMRVTDLNVGDTAAAEHPAEFTKLVADRAAKGWRTALYSCTEHQPGNFSLSAPVESYWTAVNAGEETDGFMRWAYDAWVADPLNDATHNAFEPGDPFSIYPAEKNAADKSVKSSVRLERMAEGVRDVNKVRAMLREIPDLKSQVAEMYAKIRTTARINNKNYMTEAQVKQLASEMNGFKTDLAALTKTYIERKKNGTTTISKVTIDGDAKQNVTLGGTLQLNATVTPDNALNKSVTWTSSRPAVASVSASGVVTALKTGTTTITATSVADQTKTATVQVTVTPQTVAKGVHYYSFDDSTAKDSWGSRNGTVDSAASFADGKAGKALKVTDGKGVTLDGEQGVGDNWSVGYWVNSTAALTGQSSVMMDKEKKFAFSLKMAADRDSGFRVGTGNGDVLTFKYDFQPNTWYYVTWTQDKSAGLTMYVNGTKVGTTNNWTTTHAVTAPIDVIGGTGFTGLIDEVKVYDRVLTAAEVQAGMLTPGLNLTATTADVYIGETTTIGVNLVGGNGDDEITFTSSDPDVATVDAEGEVTGVGRGVATITVKGGGFTETVTVTVTRKLTIKNTLPQYKLSEDHLSDVHKSEDTSNQYFGQPDMVRTKTGRLITSFPQGHGKGPLIMKISDDEGKTWTQKTNIPASWAKSQETPTMYVLTLADGTERIMLITACPGWTDGVGDGTTGWNTSYSDDNGETWTEYTHWYTNHADGTKNNSIVGMASLVQLKDKSGKYIQKWMGVYHDYGYVNWKTYLTFDENGKEHWSEPEKYLAQYRDIESTYQMCEIGMFRSPDGKRIIGLARSQSHNNPATLIYSDDEGETWSKPMDLPGSLAGERHKAAYDPISGRLVITFREINYDLNGNNRFDGANDWNAGDWVAWVGTYDQLINQEDGEYRILLDEDWAQNAKSGDTGYAGVVTLADGTFIMDSYGHWDKEFSEQWGFGKVTTDRCYIKQAKFKLADIEYANGLIDRTALRAAIAKAGELKESDWKADGWKALVTALDAAKAGDADTELQQVQIDRLTAALNDAIKALKPAGGEQPDPDPNPDPKPDPGAKVDKTELNQLIAQAQALDLSLYTDKTVNDLKAALAKAREASVNEKATDAQVKAAAKALSQAIAALQRRSDGPGGGSGSGSEGSGTGSGSDGKTDGKGGLSSTGADVAGLTAMAALLLVAAAGCGVEVRKRRG